MNIIQKYNSDSGISVIEALIAIAIFSIGSLAVGNLLYSTTGSVRASHDLTEATFIAEEYLAQTLSLRYRNTGITECADCMKSKIEVVGGKYNVSVNINPDPPPAGDYAIITVNVTWGGVLGILSRNVNLQYLRSETRSSGI